MLRILVTGSSGFIASRFIEKLKERDVKVIGLDIKPGKYTGVLCDIREGIPEFSSVDKIDHCLHFAAIANLDYARDHPIETIQVNVMGTGNVADWCRRNEVVMNYISSCCVYGNTPVHPTGEHDPKWPTEIYGCTKLAGEYLVLGLHKLHDSPYNIIRPASVYGPGMRKELCIYRFLKWSYDHRPLLIHGTGEQTRSFIYVDDLINGITKILNNGIRNETFNLAGPEEVSVLQIADLCWNVFDAPYEFNRVRDRKGQVLKEQINIEKARKLLDWEPRTFVNGFYKTVEWISSFIGKPEPTIKKAGHFEFPDIDECFDK